MRVVRQESRTVNLAVVSHILPPSPSGQSVMLGRILEGWGQESLCLISCTDYSGAPVVDQVPGFERLAAAYRHVRPSRPSRLTRLLPASARTLVQAKQEIRARSAKIESILRQQHCEVVVACSGDLHDLPAAFRASRRVGLPLIAYLFDDYLYQWTGDRRRVAARLEPELIAQAAAVIVPNRAAGDAYRERYGIEAQLIPNPCEIPILEELDAQPPLFDPGCSNIVYTGAIYHAHYDAFQNLLEAMRRIERPGLKLHLFTAQSEEELKQGGISGPEVVRHAHVPPTEIPAILRQADLLFLPLAFESPIPEVIRTSAPGKMGEYLAVGRPILVHAPPDAFVSKYFGESRCGIVADRNDAESIRQALRKLYDKNKMAELGRNARAAAERDFRLSSSRQRFRDIIDAVS